MDQARRCMIGRAGFVSSRLIRHAVALRHAAGLGLVVAFFAPAPALAQTLQVRNIALSGQQAPGAPAGVVFAGFDSFSINASGRVGMSATLSGPGVTSTNNAGVWWNVPGGLQLVMRTGDPAPGQPGRTYVSTNPPNLSDLGIMTYISLIRPTGGGSLGSSWTISPTSPPAAFQVDFTQVPGLPAGVLWNGANLANINASGVLAFRAILGGTVAGSGHWIGTPGNLSVVALDGAPTGLLSGVNFAGVLNDYNINSAGAYAFATSLAGASITSSNDQAIWLRSPAGVLSLVAREGDQVPGMASGVVYNTISTSRMHLDSTGRVVFVAFLAGPGITGSNDGVVMAWDNGAVTMIAQEGTQAPGAPAGVLWGDSFGVTLGGQGAVVLRTSLTGPGITNANGSGIWKSTAGGPFALIARAGSPAPGTSPVRNFDSFSTNTVNIAANAHGRMMFAAPLTTGAEGIWIESPSGMLQLVLLEGTSFDVNDDPNITVLKTVLTLAFPPAASNDDGRRNAYSDSDEVAFRLTFTDATSGAFIAGFPPAGCDDLDFNNDGIENDPTDLEAFISVYSGGPCIPTTATCNDIDFNNDAIEQDPTDIESFLSVYSGGPCL